MMISRCQPGVIEVFRQFVKVFCGRARGATAGDADLNPIELGHGMLPGPVGPGDDAAAGPEAHIDGAVLGDGRLLQSHRRRVVVLVEDDRRPVIPGAEERQGQAERLGLRAVEDRE
jgi:hypothetical protein